MNRISINNQLKTLFDKSRFYQSLDPPRIPLKKGDFEHSSPPLKNFVE